MNTIDTLSNDYPDLLLGGREPPCLSLYQPTHRQHPDNLQDPNMLARSVVDGIANTLVDAFVMRAQRLFGVNPARRGARPSDVYRRRHRPCDRETV